MYANFRDKRSVEFTRYICMYIYIHVHVHVRISTMQLATYMYTNEIHNILTHVPVLQMLHEGTWFPSTEPD